MHNQRRSDFVVAFAVLVVSSCSSTRLVAKPTTEADKTAEGFRYYLPTPYVLVKKPILLASKATASTTATTTTTQPAAPAAPGTKKQNGTPAALSGSGENDESAETAEPAKKEDKEEAKPAPADEGEGLSIVMMPDYCEQQAVTIDVSNAKLDVELQFVDGWRLEHVKSTADSTLAMTSWIDLAKTTLTSAKDIVAAVFGAKTTEEEEGGGTEGQSGKAARRTTTMEKRVQSNETITETWLHPGVYPLFVRGTDGACTAPMKLNEKWFEGHTFERSRAKTDDTTSKTISK